MVIFSSFFLDIFSVVVAVLVVIFSYVKWNYSYWKRRGVPFSPPQFPHGNLEKPGPLKNTIGVQVRNLYERTRQMGLRHCGIYIQIQPAYLVADLELIKHIMATDFQHFVDRGNYYNEKDDPIGAHLFAIGGSKWRHLRTKLTPTFTSGKMKMMFPILRECVDQLLVLMESKKDGVIDIKDVSESFTIDVIGSCAFGLECNAIKEPDCAFKVYGKKVFTFNKSRTIKVAFSNAFPNLAKFFKITKVSKDVADFFTKMVTETVEYREKNNVSRKDFLQLLIDLMKEDDENAEFTMMEVVAQSFLFFLAGYETSATTMTFALYQLAKNPEMQDKLREEVDTALAKHGGEISYEAIMDMKYMNQVIEETLRIHPPAPLVTRLCVKEYHVPGTDVVLEKGTRVVIPIYGVHMDEEYHPEPEKFDPERFSEENRNSMVPFSYMAFGEGPRTCIGMRFGMMQAKVGLAALLRNFKFSVNPKTREPLRYTAKSIVLSAEGGIWLDATSI